MTPLKADEPGATLPSDWLATTRAPKFSFSTGSSVVVQRQCYQGSTVPCHTPNSSKYAAANMERGVTDPLESRLDSAGKSLNLN